MPSAIFPLGSPSGAASRVGRGQCTGAPIISPRVSACVEANACPDDRPRSATGARAAVSAWVALAAMRLHHHRSGGRKPRDRRSRESAPTAQPQLLRGEQPPIARLAALAQLELDAALE